MAPKLLNDVRRKHSRAKASSRRRGVHRVSVERPRVRHAKVSLQQRARAQREKSSLTVSRCSVKTSLAGTRRVSTNTWLSTAKTSRRKSKAWTHRPKTEASKEAEAHARLAIKEVIFISTPMRCRGAETIPSMPSNSAPRNTPAVVLRLRLPGCETRPTAG